MLDRQQSCAQRLSTPGETLGAQTRIIGGMKHTTIAVIVFVFALVISIPTSVHADHDASNGAGTQTSSVNSLEQRLEALTKMIDDLKKRLEDLKKGTATTTHDGNRPNVCDRVYSLGNFGRGMSGDGVRSIQSFLADEGRLSRDSVTGYFGNVTENALKQWQTASGVIKSDDASGGHFGTRTRDAISKRCGGTATSSTFMLVPKEGTAPLTVTISAIPSAVQAKINGCKNSVGRLGRSGNGLTIDWGDGTVSPSDTGTTTGRSCAREVRQHTYTTPGTYTAKIKSWHPGPTDAPVTDWEGTANVVVKEKQVRATSTKLLRSSAALKARTALARDIDERTSSITVVAVEVKEWTDGCLGLGGAAESCLAAITPGYRVTLKHDGDTYYARTNKTGSVVRLEE